MKGVGEGDPIGKSNDIENNTIGWNKQRAGILCTSGSTATITYNDILSNRVYGVWSGSGSNPVINYNNICNNGGGASGPGYGVYNDDSGITIDSINNWWGHESGPYHPTENPLGQGDKVSDDVDFKPFSGDRF
ncbi:MAG: right-handed parallel beta-helix repeat-containing protein [Thermoplasmata archaeon]|nr:MAG: right-handed parallel beta-helix repeat-containing protein [Thermoplasmata archaeon]